MNDTKKRLLRTVGALVFGAVGVAGCGSDSPPSTPAATYAPHIDPAEFSTTIDSPFLPMAPGTRTIYEGRGADGLERIVVEVTRDTKTVMGVTTVVVRDTASLDGKVIEDTYDWYAQHRDGSVWYFGEDTKELEDGRVVSTHGSWEAGVDGAQPGIVMPSRPQAGQKFRQELYAGEAEDEAEVLGVAETVTVPFGSFTGGVKTLDTTPLQPEVREHKYYARGVGLVLAVDVAGGNERTELVAVERG
jgi:hypothetical protein